MERDGEDSKGQRKPQGFQLFGRRRRRDTLLFALKQIFFSRKENPTDVPKSFPFALKQIFFSGKENRTDFQSLRSLWKYIPEPEKNPFSLS